MIKILEISQWLLKKGFEPDMWFDHDKTNGALFICPEYVKDEFENPSSANLSPWISLNRALELLQEGTKGLGANFKEMTTGETGKAIPNIVINEKVIGVVDNFMRRTLFTEYVEGSIHLAALRLLKQVVAAGYLKGESDG
jgi:hypothetical protein